MKSLEYIDVVFQSLVGRATLGSTTKNAPGFRKLPSIELKLPQTLPQCRLFRIYGQLLYNSIYSWWDIRRRRRDIRNSSRDKGQCDDSRDPLRKDTIGSRLTRTMQLYHVG
jgi:hypothetical protein